MVTSRRGQSPAWQTKVMDPCPGALEEGRPQKQCNIRSHDRDAVSSKPASAGRGMVEDIRDGCVSSCSVVACGNSRCKTYCRG